MQLALTGNLTQLRDHLKDGSECPLCGSTHHPYSKLEDSTLDSVFKEVKQRYDDLDNESKSLNNRYLKIESESGNLEIRIKENKNKLIDITNSVQQISEELRQNNLINEFDIFSDSLNKKMLTQENDIDQYQFQKISVQVERYDSDSKHLFELKEKNNNLEKKVSETQILIINKNNSIDSCNTEIAGLKEKITENESLLNKGFAVIDKDFSNNEWQKNWKENPELFLSKLNLFAQDEWAISCSDMVKTELKH